MEIYTYVDTPIGIIYISEENGYITYIGNIQPESSVLDTTSLLTKASKLLDMYFSGNYKRKFDLPLNISGTRFEQRVYKELMKVEYGKTISYGNLAAKIGSPGAARAVGNALHKNPLLIAVPCHRVIGSDGSLKNFALGVNIKKYLLDLERR